MSSESDDDLGFYFESDHLALRGNRKYQQALRTLVMLQVARMRVQKQIEGLELAKATYMANPDLLVHRYENNLGIIPPDLTTVIKIPELPNLAVKRVNQEHFVKREIGNSNIEIKQEQQQSGFSEEELNADGKRAKRPWSCAEQQRLEQLLIEYPTEEIEMNRFKKIAKALGDRTPLQVTSRVQKYFLKLRDAGLPIPGRIPKNRRIGIVKPKYLFKRTTFFPKLNVPVDMPEEDNILDVPRSCNASPSTDTASRQSPDLWLDSSQSPLLETTKDAQKQTLHMLQIILAEKESITEGYNHDPFIMKCDICKFAPISKTRWRCNTCTSLLHYCLDCHVTLLLTKKFEHFAHDVVIDNQ